jgi:hypothetical protein
LTLGLGIGGLGPGEAPAIILQRLDGFQVARVYALLDLTEVIDMETLGDLTLGLFVIEAVSPDLAA